MKKTFIPGSIFRHFLTRQTQKKFVRHSNGIDHFILCITGMKIPSFKNNLSISSIKIFKFQFPDFSAIQRISKLSPKLFHIKMIGPLAYLFIRRKANTDFSMFYFRIFNQVFHRCQYLSNPGFIIRPQQTIAIRRNQSLPDIISQFRKIIRRNGNSLLLVQNNIIPTIIRDNLRIYKFSLHLRTRIQMGNETHRRNLPVHIRRKKSHHIAIFIHTHLLQPHRFHFMAQNFCKFQLPPRAGSHPRMRVRLGAKLDVT